MVMQPIDVVRSDGSTTCILDGDATESIVGDAHDPGQAAATIALISAVAEVANALWAVHANTKQVAQIEWDLHDVSARLSEIVNALSRRP